MSLKRNRAPGHDDLDVNIFASVYELSVWLIFNKSVTLGIFPENMKIVKTTPTFKSDKK